MFISGNDLRTSIRSTAPLSSICFLEIIVLFIPDFEKSEEFGTKLIISTQGISFLFSHLQEKFLSSEADNIVELIKLIKKNNINLGIIFSFKIFLCLC